MKVTLSISIILLLTSCAGGGFVKGGNTRNMGWAPAATIIRSSNYTILGRAEGQSSTFFLLGLWPVTSHPDINYALNDALQKVKEGQSITNLAIWHETHYFFPVGTVSVVMVEGDVISFRTEDKIEKNTDRKVNRGNKK